MYRMVLIRFMDTVKDKCTGKDVQIERIEVAGANMLMKLVYKAIPYEIIGRFQ